jgi:hypothetical protein
MRTRAASGERVFKTALFARAARKALLTDAELCAAMAQVMLGHADDLGGGVFKKLLGKNLYRSIVLARGGKYWVYEFLFAKKVQANIKDYQLAQWRVTRQRIFDVDCPASRSTQVGRTMDGDMP